LKSSDSRGAGTYLWSLLRIFLASSLETFIAGGEFNAIHLTVTFPAHDRVILEHSYAGFGGGLTLMEDVMSKYVGPL